MNHSDYISIDPNIRSGRPCITGTRISVYDVLSWLASGMSYDEIIDDFPNINKEQIPAFLSFAADKERKLKISI